MRDPELPIPLGSCSNGECDPLPPSPVAREFASPVGIGPAAGMHPDANFVVYHS